MCADLDVVADWLPGIRANERRTVRGGILDLINQRSTD